MRLPTVDLPLSITMTLFTLSATTMMPPGRRRMWALSGLITPLLALLGFKMAASWVVAGAREFTVGAIELVELMKAYFAVDLAYCAFFHWTDTSILDFWAHHVFYIWYLDWLGYTGQTGVLQPFLVMEIPTAIRAMGELIPVWKPRMRPAFMISFIVFRVLWPVWVLTRVWMTPLNFAVGVAAITLHCYWLGVMLRRQLLPGVPLLAVRY